MHWKNIHIANGRGRACPTDHRFRDCLRLSAVRKDDRESRASAEETAAHTWRFGLLRNALSSPLLFLDVGQPLVLVPVLDLKVPAHAIEASDGELLGVVVDHGRATQACTEVFGTGADGGGVVGRFEDLASQAGERSKS